MTKLCNTCEYLKFCARSGIEDVGCDRYKRDTTTNEEWLRQANTEQLAEELLAWWFDGANTYSQFGLFQHEIDEAKEKIVEWLKQPHTNE